MKEQIERIRRVLENLAQPLPNTSPTPWTVRSGHEDEDHDHIDDAFGIPVAMVECGEEGTFDAKAIVIAVNGRCSTTEIDAARAALDEIEREKDRCRCNCHDQPAAKEDMDLDEHDSCSDCASEIALENGRFYDPDGAIRAAAFKEAAKAIEAVDDETLSQAWNDSNSGEWAVAREVFADAILARAKEAGRE